MSVFTNPPSASAEQAETYIRAVLELLGDHDPIEVLEATPGAVREVVARVPDQALGTPEGPGKWSIREVVRHLADSEIVWAFRLRMVLGQERPELQGYDQDAWAERLRYTEADVGTAMEEFQVIRRGNLRMLEGLPAADLRRVGVHAERGEESVEHMIRLYAGHDLVHLRQMRRIVDAVAAS